MPPHNFGAEKKFCSQRHQAQYRYHRKIKPLRDAETARRRKQKGDAVGITDEAVARAKELYPSCARDWDYDMVEASLDRIYDKMPRVEGHHGAGEGARAARRRDDDEEYLRTGVRPRSSRDGA